MIAFNCKEIVKKLFEFHKECIRKTKVSERQPSSKIERMKKILLNHKLLFLINILLIAFVSMFGPEEKNLGANVKLVYIHGAWVLAAEVAFALAAIFGLAALVLEYANKNGSMRSCLFRWSHALGLTGVVYWITYLPLSMLAMQTNWNGLFLAEPRFRLAITFAVVGILLQVGLWVINDKKLVALANIAYIIALRVVFSNAANIMHPPPSPIFNSGNISIIIFFVFLIGLTLSSAFLIAVMWADALKVRK